MYIHKAIHDYPWYITFMIELTLILDNIRSLHNVGSILRSADAFAVTNVIMCGVTPYPKIEHDKRLPHVIERARKTIAKTALGAETTIQCSHSESTEQAIQEVKAVGVHVVALEQDSSSVNVTSLTGRKHPRLAVVFGEETKGLTKRCLELCDEVAEIPMFGDKESLNVSVAAGIALFAIRS